MLMELYVLSTFFYVLFYFIYLLYKIILQREEKSRD